MLKNERAMRSMLRELYEHKSTEIQGKLEKSKPSFAGLNSGSFHATSRGQEDSFSSAKFQNTENGTGVISHRQ